MPGPPLAECRQSSGEIGKQARMLAGCRELSATLECVYLWGIGVPPKIHGFGNLPSPNDAPYPRLRKRPSCPGGL
jgi:hypothetical protein